MPNITFKTTLPAKSGTPLSELIEEAKFKIKIPCGKGKCGKCACLVSGQVSEPSERERKVLTASQLEQGIRLACEVTVLGDVTVEKLPKK